MASPVFLSPAPRALAQEPAEPPTAAPAEPHLLQVPSDMDVDNLPERKAEQLATRDRFDVPIGFSFRDRREASGITFRHRIVDDAGLRYKPVHYDHGNGLVTADVDGDGRQDLYFLTQLGRNELWRNLGGGRFEEITDAAGVALEDQVAVSGTFADFDNDGDPDLYVTTVRRGNHLFVNDGKGKFEDVTEEAGLVYSGHSSAALAFDFDNDGWLDLFVVNVGRYTVEETGRSGYQVGRANAFQAHRDPTLAEPSLLYRNRGDGTFEDVTEKALVVDRSWSGDAAAADFNGDGWQDLYLLDMQGSDVFFENVRGEFFADRTEKYFPRTSPGSMGVQVFDWNRDGRLDLFITDMHSDMIEELPREREKEKIPTRRGDVVLKGVENNIMGNSFFQATEDGFEEVSDAIGVENYWPWGVSAGDLNADGWEDLFITASMNFPFRYGVNSVLLNNRGERFLDAEFILGVEPRAGELTQPWFDLHCPPAADGEEPAAEVASPANHHGGHAEGEGGAASGGEAAGEAAQPTGADLRWTWENLGATSSGEGPHPLCRGLSGSVRVMAAKGSRSSVLLDLEGDGDLDVVTNEFNGAPQVLVSDLAGEAAPPHHLWVDLVGTRSNRDGLGARVTMVAGGAARMQLMDGKSGYLSQSSQPLYFGLGDVASVDRVEVAWPSGASQVVERPPVGKLLVVTEPAEQEAGGEGGDDRD